MSHITPVIDHQGEIFGRLEVLARATNYCPPGAGSNGQARWLCRCECGTKVVVLGQSLRRGETKSCGCSSTELRQASKAPKREEYTSTQKQILSEMDDIKTMIFRMLDSIDQHLEKLSGAGQAAA